MDKLEKARAQIDKIDSRMALLFEQRMALAAEIAQHKKQQGLPVLNTAREKEVLVKNTARLRDKSLQGYYIKFMEQVLGLSRRYQTQLMGRTVVACPSHEKAASQQVISQLFPGAQTTEAASMEDVFRAVEAGDAAWGVVPLATSGSDAPLTALELCARHQCYIGAMADLPTGRGKTTRFMVLSHQASEKGDRMALLVTLDNEVGYLAHIIEIIAEEGFAIEALLCRFALTRDELRSHGAAGLALFEEARTMAAADTDGLVESDADQFRVTERGRPFVRTIAARFDTYLETGTARHSLAV